MKNLDELSPREKEVLCLIAAEHSSKEIASKLYVSYETIHSHRKNLLRKMEVKNTAGLVRVGLQRGLIPMMALCFLLMIFSPYTIDAQNLGLHVDEGHNVLFGESETGAGNKFIWNQEKGSLRVGELTSGRADYWNPDSIGNNSYVFGFNSRATKNGQFVLGNYNNPLGLGAIVLGNENSPKGWFSFVQGLSNHAPSYLEIAMGNYNTDYAAVSSMGSRSADRLFSIGNGTSATSRNNAFTIYKNGAVHIQDSAGHNSPLQLLNEDQYKHPFYSTPMQMDDGSGIQVDAHFMLVTDNYTDAGGFFSSDDGAVIFNSGDNGYYLRIVNEDKWWDNDGNPYDNNAVIAYIDGNGLWKQSDARIKSNIHKIVSATEKINKINGYSYTYRQSEGDKEKNNKKNDRESIGFLAQELEKVIPQAVSKNEYGDYHVNYAFITPVLVEAIKEQEQIIQQQKNDLSKTKNDFNHMKDALSDTKDELGKMKSKYGQLEEKFLRIEKLIMKTE